MFKPCPSRWFYLSEFFMILALLGFGYFLEWRGFLPCALCEAQRLVYVLLGLLFLIATLCKFQRWGQVFWNGLVSLIALMGFLLAARQVWLQHWPPPPGSSSCDASLYYLWQIMPLSDVIMNVLVGGPECAKVTWAFLGFSIAEWSCLWFAVFMFMALWQMLGWACLRKK